MELCLCEAKKRPLRYERARGRRRYLDLDGYRRRFLIVSWHAGDCTQHTGIAFIDDLKARLANRVQLTTDGHKAYLTVVEAVNFDADYAMLNKIFATDYAGPGRYSPSALSKPLSWAILI